MPPVAWLESAFIELKSPRRAINLLVLISPETWPIPSPELTVVVESCTSRLSVNALETCVLRDLAKSVTSFPRANRSEQRVL